LVLMIPIPAMIESHITLPLQLVSSRIAAAAIESCGIVVLREGNVLYLPGSALEVAAACSGIRSLMAQQAVAVAYGWIAEKRIWVRLVLLALTVPLAILFNSLRVLTTGLITYNLGPEWAEGWLHTSIGLVLFLLASGLLIGVHRGLAAACRRWERAA
jgi:exosortase